MMTDIKVVRMNIRSHKYKIPVMARTMVFPFRYMLPLYTHSMLPDNPVRNPALIPFDIAEH